MGLKVVTFSVMTIIALGHLVQTSSVEAEGQRSFSAELEKSRSVSGLNFQTLSSIKKWPGKSHKPSPYPKFQNSVFSESSRPSRVLKRKNFRLTDFLQQFHLDFSKFDTTCIKRSGRGGVAAPLVKNARILKYSRKRNRALPKNQYGMVLYECETGFIFPSGSGDRMFCSRSKWVGPRPVCLPQDTLENSESGCTKCTQICKMGEDSKAPTTCACYEGYKMVNGSCADVNECATNNGGCFGICFNKLGSFQCSCPPGFQVGPDGKKCIDRNECLLRNGHGPCQDRCNNTIGHYICSCESIPGTKLANDKHSCEDRNECDDGNNFGCSHNCLNTFGNAFCSCPNGFILSLKDYKTCLPQFEVNDLEEQAFRPENLMEPSEETVTGPTNDLTSPEIQSSPTAECPPGSELDSENPQICIEHEGCNENGGCDQICIPSGTVRFCSCRPGYELLNETTCADVEECVKENGGCDHNCVNTEGSFHCECKKGYYLLDDHRTCKVKFCEEPPRLSLSSAWKCDLPIGIDISSVPRPTDLRPVGTRCKFQCQTGTIRQLNPQSRSLSQRYDPFNYDLVHEPQTIVDENLFIIECLPSGSWKQSDQFTCLPLNCSTLWEPEHGSLYPESCRDENGVPVHSQCFVSCLHGYYPKNGRIRTCSKSLKWFPEEKPMCMKLPPTPLPHIHCPSDLILDLKAGQATTHVVIPQPQANMDWYRYVEADPPWAKNLEWDVAAGVTQVVFTARSPISNDSATCQFKIHIVDREAPRVQGCPTSFEVRLDPTESSKTVWWPDPKFTDNVLLHYVQQSHTPGHLFTRGTHHVVYVAGDAEGNRARCAFTITVHGAQGHDTVDHSFYANNVVSGRHMIICPNLKTGQWNIHFAYYLPPGCRYPSSQYDHFPNMFKQLEDPKSENFSKHFLQRRFTARIRRFHPRNL